jgi:hypothetical protein
VSFEHWLLFAGTEFVAYLTQEDVERGLRKSDE